MLTPQALDDVLERLRRLTGSGVLDAAESLQHETLAFAPWEGLEAAVPLATLQAVAFANHRGGDLVFGIDAAGTITGCPGAQPVRLTQEVFARTRPGIVVEVWSYPVQEGVLIVVTVLEGVTLHATAEGVRVRRVGRSNLPITPDQDAALIGARSEVDFTDRTLPGVRSGDLDPLQITYLREILRRKNDQSELLELTDEELLQALGLMGEGGAPRVAAILLLGSRRILKERLPQTEVVYIHLDGNEEPDVQEQLYLPLLHTLSRLQDLIEARNRFTVLRQGLFHFQVKDFDEEVYREALVNALVHRDYSRRDGSVHVTQRADRLEISNPGGLIGGISVDNILYHPPRHRNRRLTEVLQQLGLMERAGAGVNRLYRYLLRKGKEPPEYQVTAESVRLSLQGGNFDESFATFVYDEETRGRLFGLDMLIVLSSLKRMKMIDRATAAQLSQRPDRAIGNTLTKMVELGYLERVGAGRGSAYRLAGWVYEKLGSRVGYFRDRGLGLRRQRALILEVVEELGRLTLEECQELCGIDASAASRLLEELEREGQLRLHAGAWLPATSSSDGP